MSDWRGQMRSWGMCHVSRVHLSSESKLGLLGLVLPCVCVKGNSLDPVLGFLSLATTGASFETTTEVPCHTFLLLVYAHWINSKLAC